MQFKEVFLTLKTKLKENKFFTLILVITICLLIFLFVFSSNSNKNGSSSNNSTQVELYVKNLQEDLQKIIEKIDGAGKTSVLLNIDSGMETVLAKKITTTENNGIKEVEETPILVNGKTVTLKENFPKIVGAVIVCEGAKNISVVNSIINATTSLLNIDKNQIEIIKMK